MFYRENGQFKTTYQADQQIFPIAQDRWGVLLIVAFAFLAVPLLASEYLFRQSDNEALRWQVQAAGETLYHGNLTLALPPEGSDEITLLDDLILPPGARAVWLTLEVVQPRATDWSPADHRVAWQQYPLPAPRLLSSAMRPGRSALALSAGPSIAGPVC